MIALISIMLRQLFTADLELFLDFTALVSILGCLDDHNPLLKEKEGRKMLLMVAFHCL